MTKNILTAVPLLVALAAAQVAVAQTGTNPSPTKSESTGSSGSSSANRITSNDDEAITNLQSAAQNLREAIQAMAQAPAGETRADVMRQGNEALLEVQRAMINLPPDLLTANVSESDYKKAVDKLQKTAQELHDATLALSKEPNSKRRNNAIKKINEALMETNQTLINTQIASK